MKYSELEKLLKQNGSELVQHGTRHDKWKSNITGKTFTIPRHRSKEVSPATLNSILKDAGLK